MPCWWRDVAKWYGVRLVSGRSRLLGPLDYILLNPGIPGQLNTFQHMYYMNGIMGVAGLDLLFQDISLIKCLSNLLPRAI